MVNEEDQSQILDVSANAKQLQINPRYSSDDGKIQFGNLPMKDASPIDRQAEKIDG